MKEVHFDSSFDRTVAEKTKAKLDQVDQLLLDFDPHLTNDYIKDAKYEKEEEREETEAIESDGNLKFED